MVIYKNNFSLKYESFLKDFQTVFKLYTCRTCSAIFPNPSINRCDGLSVYIYLKVFSVFNKFVVFLVRQIVIDRGSIVGKFILKNCQTRVILTSFNLAILYEMSSGNFC